MALDTSNNSHLVRTNVWANEVKIPPQATSH